MKKTNKFNKYFLLTWKKLWIIIITGFVSILLHNLFYAIFKIEEAFFFIIVIIILPIYTLIAITYTIIYYIKKHTKK